MKNEIKKKKEKEENLNITLPDDLIVQILLRLPVKSLLRFKSVCKKWLSIISDPKFGESHCDLAAALTHRFLLKKFGDKIQSFDTQADDSTFVNLKFPPYGTRCYQTLGSCRGLLLLTKLVSPTSDLILWNPSTGAHREIPATYADWDSWFDNPSTCVRQGIPSYFTAWMFRGLCGFGYDQFRDDYLLVLIRLDGLCIEPRPNDGFIVRWQCRGPDMKPSRPPIEVLSLKTSLPSFYDDGVKLDYVLGDSKCGLFLGTSLHWLVKSKATQLHVVLAFDLITRRLSEIPLPHDLAAELARLKKCSLVLLGECLSVCYSSGGDGHEVSQIWVMRDYKVQSSWVKLFKLPVHDIDDDAMPFMPLYFTKGGGVVGSDKNGKFKRFNSRGELIKNYTDVLDGGDDTETFFFMYRESLVTLPVPGDFEEENEDASQNNS